MVFVFGVDVPLVELMLVFTVISAIILVEVTVIMLILLYQLRQLKGDRQRKEKKGLLKRTMSLFGRR
jgi:heme/copper-type cytochrome/quinol oxidase subunit 2